MKRPPDAYWVTSVTLDSHRPHPSSPAQTFEGIPAPYDTKKRVVVPQALKVSQSLRPSSSTFWSHEKAGLEN